MMKENGWIQKWFKTAGTQKARYLFAALLIVSLIFIGDYYAKQWRAENLYSELQAKQGHISLLAEQALGILEQMPEEQKEAPVEMDVLPHLENTVDFVELWEINEDIYAWIEIPGTQVDYPVAQHPTDDAYYLNHTIEGVSGLPGSIYSEKVHPKDFSAVQTVLYGHNMKNGTMFGSLHSYEDVDFFKEYPYVYIHLPEKTLVYGVFAAVRFSDVYLPIYKDYEVEKEFMSFVDEVKSSEGQVSQTLNPSYEDRLLILSTCMNNDENHRFLVAGVQIGEYLKE